jgi:hypothetical protein
MRRAAILSVLALAALLALPQFVLAGAAVSVRREVRTGAQAAFDTAVFDGDGNIVPGSYLAVQVGIGIDMYVENHVTVATGEPVLWASVQRYDVDDDGNQLMGPIWDGWTTDATVTLDPSFRSASGAGILTFQECDYFAEPPTCIDRGTLALTVTFTGTTHLAPEPQHFTDWFDSHYARHGAAITRALTARAELAGQDLGISLWGNFFRVHQGETEVWPPMSNR